MTHIIRFASSHYRYVQSRCNSFHVANREDLPLHRIAWASVTLVCQSWCVVRTDRPIETDFVIELEYFGHVGWPIVVKRLAETLARTVNITEVYKKYLALSAELPYQRFNVLTHQLEVGLAEGDAIDRARH